MRESISDWITFALDSAIRFFWPEADPSFPAWLYAITDVQWVVILQALILLILYTRGRRTRRAIERTSKDLQELWRELGAQSVNVQSRIARLRRDIQEWRG